MSRGVKFRFIADNGLGPRWGLFLILLIPVLAPLANAQNQTFMVAYTQVRQPQFVVPQSNVSLPEAFSIHPFSIYQLYHTKHPTELETVLCVKLETAEEWKELADKQSWKAVTNGGFVLYIPEQSSIEERPEIQAKIVDHLRYAPDSAASGGLLSEWSFAARYIQNTRGLRETVLGSLSPTLKNQAGDYEMYSQWLIHELTTMESLIWEIDPRQDSGEFAVSIMTKKGSRLNRLFNGASESGSYIFDFVPGDVSKLILGQLNGSHVTSYMNYFFKGTKSLEHETFQAIRSKLNELDPGIFDRWDGTWAVWTPEDSEERVLLLGGGFLSTDLTDLFDILGSLPLSETPVSLRLDQDNMVVGFTRIRSFEWIDEGAISKVGRLLPKPLYFGVANGYLAIAESESHLVDLIFSLNSKKPLKNSAQSLIENQPGLAVGFYQGDEVVKSVDLNRGRLVYRRAETPEWFYKFFGWVTKEFAH